MATEEKISRWIQPAVRTMSAYHVPDAEGLIKLDAMENPYCWPQEIKQAWLDTLADAEINRYPDAEGKTLKEQLGRVFSIPDSAQILLGNGSDEIIQIICLAMSQPGTVILAPEPGFVMYRLIAGFTGARFVSVPLTAAEFALDPEAMLAAIDEYQPGIIFLAWPNNPTGNLFDEAGITAVIKHAPGVVVVDEAYHIFAQQSFMPLLKHYDNLLVMRTLSKLGLAGLRLGFLAGDPAWIREFEKLRLPYNVGVLTQRSVAFILAHIDVLNNQAAAIRRDRDIMYRELQQLRGITVWPSAANFLLMRLETGSADVVHGQLKEQGILVKNLSHAHPLLHNCLRITVGTAKENRAFMTALKKVVSREAAK